MNDGLIRSSSVPGSSSGVARAPVWGSTPTGVAEPSPSVSPTRPGPSGAPTPAFQAPSPPTPTALVVVGVVVAVALLAGLIAWRVSDSSSGETASVTTTTADPGPTTTQPNGGLGQPLPQPGQPFTPPTTTPPTDPSAGLLAEIGELADWVERNRSLEFTAEPVVKIVDDATYGEQIRLALEADREMLDDVGKVYAAIDLIDPNVAFLETLALAMAAGGGVFYDPAANIIYVRDGELTPYRAWELVGALTMALDDQHHELDRPDLDAAPDESGLGIRALATGDAERLKEMYLQAMPSDQLDEQIDEAAELDAAIEALALPPGIYAYTAAPGLLGEAFADALVFSSDPQLDAAFVTPPITSEQLIDPDLYLDGEAPLEVEPPPADGEVFDEGLFGEYLLIMMLSPQLGTSRAYDVGDGWGGDWFVAWTQGEGGPACVRVDLTGDDSVETDEIETGLLEWSEQTGATVERIDDDVVRFTKCAASAGGSASKV